MSCFNGMGIGKDFIAPIVSRQTRAVRLVVKKTKNGKPLITKFGAYNGKGKLFNDIGGLKARKLVGQ